MRQRPPIGTVTFLFTDIEGSTRLLQALGRGYAGLLDRHASIMRRALADHEGIEVGTEGDAFFAVFRTASAAVAATVAAQRSLAGEPWPGGHPVAVRMGLHTGEGALGANGYVGLDVHRAARVAAAAHGGQVLVTDATRALVEPGIPDGVGLRDLGLHRLKDIEQPEHLYQLVIHDLPDAFPPIRTLDARQTNLPAERTTFIGRDREVAEIRERLRTVRLLTLTGPGGTGKTRLALKVSDQQLDHYADGVYFVDLSPITDPELVPTAIAQAIRLREQPGRQVIETLIDHLRDRHQLLVLDNVEHLPGVAKMVGALLDAAPRLTVLATSRIPLRIAGEQEFPVPPLALPRASETDPETVGKEEAVRLFVDRATAVRPSFRLTPANAVAIGQIATRLDGLPLAIELAAGRAKLLEPDAILNRLGAKLDLLVSGARDLPVRQRTLRATMEWSHDLLEPIARRLFARLAAFSGGWTLDAAESVCAPGLGASVLDQLGALLDHSLINVAERLGSSRFVMLDTVHEFAAEQLGASGDADGVRHRHALYFLELVEAPRSEGQELFKWPSRSLDAERDNIRAALRWAIEQGEASVGLRMAAAVWTVWPTRDIAEGRAWLERFLALPGTRRRDAIEARALASLGAIALFQNDGDGARAVLEDAVAIARELHDARVLAYAIDPLEVALRAAGDLDSGQALLAEALARAEEAGEVVLAAGLRAHVVLNTQVFGGNPAAAIVPLRNAIAVLREAGETSQVIWNVASLGTAELLANDLAAAKRDFREVLTMSHAAGDAMALGAALLGLGFVASAEGHHERLARLWGVMARLRSESGGGPVSAITERLGDPEGAARIALSDPVFEQRQAEGQAMSMSEAVAYAFERDDSEDGETGEEPG